MLLAVVLDIRNCPLCGNSAVGRAGNCVAVVEMSRLRSRAQGNVYIRGEERVGESEYVL